MSIEQFRYYTGWHQFVNEKQYDKPADPWKLLRVDPTDVAYYNHEVRLNWGLGRIEGGDWDREENCHPLSETLTYRGLTQRFEEGYDWEETVLYRRTEERFENGGTVRGYDSLEEYRDVRCAHIDELFRSIERDGYRPNEAATHEPPAQDNPYEEAYAHHLEPLVVIGRSGETHLTEGYHRFIIASILNVDEIPVQVPCRHEDWQRVRERIHDTRASGVPTELEAHGGHPDLRDITS